MEQTTDLLPLKDLQNFFRRNLQSYTTKHKIVLELANATNINAAMGLAFEPGKACKAQLLADPVAMEEFIEAYKLKTIKDLDKIQQGMLWIRYLMGKAAVSYELPELEATFTFRVVNSKTMIYCYSLHFFDESPVLFTMEHHFADYLTQNRARLKMATERRMAWV